MEAVGALGVGIVLGIRHAADPDHVVAIVQLVRPGGGTTRAARTALCWGLGHSLTTLALGSVIVLGGIRAPAGLEAAAELLLDNVRVIVVDTHDLSPLWARVMRARSR